MRNHFIIAYVLLLIVGCAPKNTPNPTIPETLKPILFRRDRRLLLYLNRQPNSQLHIRRHEHQQRPSHG